MVSTRHLERKMRSLIDKIKRRFFQAAVGSMLLYGCTTSTLTKRMEKKLDNNYTRRLRAVFKKNSSFTAS